MKIQIFRDVGTGEAGETDASPNFRGLNSRIILGNENKFFYVQRTEIIST